MALLGLFIVVSGGLVLTLEGPKWIPGMADLVPSAGGDDGRILVFLVGSSSGVDQVRKAVDPGRIAYSTPHAVALVEGRIIAANQDAVGEPLMEAGWIDREIEIFTVAKRDILPKRNPEGGAANKDVDPERLERLNALVRKDTLSYGEQMFVLQAMNDGVVF